jgi:hypothetical protein
MKAKPINASYAKLLVRILADDVTDPALKAAIDKLQLHIKALQSRIGDTNRKIVKMIADNILVSTSLPEIRWVTLGEDLTIRAGLRTNLPFYRVSQPAQRLARLGISYVGIPLSPGVEIRHDSSRTELQIIFANEPVRDAFITKHKLRVK